MADRIRFNQAYTTGKELDYIAEAQSSGHLSGDGPFTERCQAWIEEHTGCEAALLTHSCTGALELASLLLDVQPGDEVIMPSFTYVTTANAFVLRGAVPVFVDIRQDTLNLDETLVESAITPCSRIIVPVHYAGVACEMDPIMSLANRHGLRVVEDAAQGFAAAYRGKALGTFVQLGAYSFHETKNVTCGEGGGLLINHPELTDRAEIIREKGTDRSRFFRNEVDRYTWQDTGSSFLPGELTAAYLLAQLQKSGWITEQRLILWERYHALLGPLESKGLLRRPVVPDHCQNNAHMYYVLLPSDLDRKWVLDELNRNHVSAVSHYVPLHSSPAGRRYSRAAGALPVTDSVSERLIRLPMWVGLTEDHQQRVVNVLGAALEQIMLRRHSPRYGVP